MNQTMLFKLNKIIKKILIKEGVLIEKSLFNKKNQLENFLLKTGFMTGEPIYTYDDRYFSVTGKFGKGECKLNSKRDTLRLQFSDVSSKNLFLRTNRNKFPQYQFELSQEPLIIYVTSYD